MGLTRRRRRTNVPALTSSRLVNGQGSRYPLGYLPGPLWHFHTAFDSVGECLKGLDSSHLKGEAAEAFRRSVHIDPPKWFKGADACEKAAGALESFADTVTWAQNQAQTAIDKWKQGTKASAHAADDHKKKVDAYNLAVDHYNAQPADQRNPSSLPPKPGTFTDPGNALLHEAQDILSAARKQRNSAADTARATIRHARDTAPPKPSYGDQLSTGLDEAQVMQDHFVGGLLKGTAGLLNFARGINPLDPYHLTHPAEHATSLNSLAAGLVTVANDPWGTGKQMVTDFMKDPSEGFGRLVPEIALTVATDGAGAAVKGARTADEVADAAAAARRAEHAEDASRAPGCKCTGREPVDFATGRMFMPQQDVTLPGSLPLAFRRDFESSYRAGGWFGPTWSSTIDQRPTIDAIGVVYHGEHNLLLAYPHPAPGTPVLPEAGPRWPLQLADPADQRTNLACNAAGLPVEIRDPLGAVTRYQRDGFGRPVTIIDPRGVSTRLEWTVDGHLARRTAADGSTESWTYDGEGNCITHTDPQGAVTRFAYGHFDVLTARTGPDHVTCTFADDTELRLTRVTNPQGLTWDYAYDPAGRLTRETDFDGSSLHHTYDAAGHLVSRTTPLGHRITFDRNPWAGSSARPYTHPNPGKAISPSLSTSRIQSPWNHSEEDWSRSTSKWQSAWESCQSFP